MRHNVAILIKLYLFLIKGQHKVMSSNIVNPTNFSKNTNKKFGKNKWKKGGKFYKNNKKNKNISEPFVEESTKEEPVIEISAMDNSTNENIAQNCNQIIEEPNTNNESFKIEPNNFSNTKTKLKNIEHYIVEDFFTEFFGFSNKECRSNTAKEFMLKHPNMSSVDEVVKFAMMDQKEITTRYDELFQKSQNKFKKPKKNLNKKSNKKSNTKYNTDNYSDMHNDDFSATTASTVAFSEDNKQTKKHKNFKKYADIEDLSIDGYDGDSYVDYDEDEYSNYSEYDNNCDDDCNSEYHKCDLTKSSCIVRLNTFDEWAYSNKCDPLELCRSGFYFTGKEDIVKCFVCGLELCEFEENDDPLDAHYNESPNCPFIASIYLPKALRNRAPDKNLDKTIKSITNLLDSIASNINNNKMANYSMPTNLLNPYIPCNQFYNKFTGVTNATNNYTNDNKSSNNNDCCDMTCGCCDYETNCKLNNFSDDYDDQCDKYNIKKNKKSKKSKK